MITKLFELRDRMTFVPVMATKVEAANEAERYLLRRSGYHSLPSNLVIMSGLVGGSDKATCCPHDWGDNRTRAVAHQYLEQHFDELESGAVVDVEFILGESAQPKRSESETA